MLEVKVHRKMVEKFEEKRSTHEIKNIIIDDDGNAGAI
jgi:hypothetical protein